MKFRIKFKGITNTLTLTLQSEDATVAALKESITNKLNLNIEESNDLKLSFNGKTAIEATETDTLKSLGFVSGDIIHIVSSHAISMNIMTTEHTWKEKEISYDSENKNEAMPTTLGNVKLPRLDETKSRGEIPEAFSYLVTQNEGIFQTDFDKFCGLLHILMVETGFIPVCSKPSSSLYNLPDSWEVKSGTLIINYTSSYQPCPSCRLAIVSAGSTVVVHGLAEVVSKNVELKLKMADFLTEEFTKLKELSVLFKNQIAIPLLMTIQHEAKGDVPLNISKLPVEILFRIFKKLPVVDFVRLSKTSTYFRSFADDKKLWKFFVTRDFGSNINQAFQHETDWKELYKSRRLRLRQHSEPPRDWWDPMHSLREPVILPRTPFPQIVGGDEDLYPNLFGLEPPLRRRNPRLNPFFPRRGGGSLGPYFGF